MARIVEVQIDGHTIPCHMAVPETGQGPGVMVLHAWWGLNDFFKELCERLAEAGFVAIAPDLYGGTTASTIAEAENLISTLDDDKAQAQIIGALEYLRQHPATQGRGVGVIGFSMGGWFALQLSILKPEEIAGAVIFYGSAEADFTPARAAYLGHYAEIDEWEPAEGVRQLEANIRAAGKEVTFYTYPGARHWFFESNRPDAYNADAAHLAWERTITFLKARLA
ncbi:MAG: dienelactone hydrolase family protein [Chloroflexi bacterium]|nr:dienelactone hydrolase family protein [Chloroflexota bacterium]